MLALFALSSLVQAGELQIDVKKPALVIVDGQALEFPEGRNKVEAKALQEGRHLIEIRGLGGTRVTELELQVGHTERVKLEYRKKFLTVLEREADAVLPPGEREARAAEPVGPAVVVNTTATSLEEEEEAARPTRSSTETIKVGSLQLLLPKRAVVEINDKPASWTASSESFLLTEQIPGDLEVSVTLDGESIFAGAIEVRAGQNQRCLLDEDQLDCDFSGMALGLPEISASMAGAVIAPTEPGEKSSAVAAVGPVTVQFALVDPKDLSTVFLDGKEVTRFGKDAAAPAITVDAGIHVLEIRSFGGDIWFQGKFTATPGAPMEVVYGETEGVTVKNRDGAWESFKK
jgi:hypothetical protein